jgi:multidrug resistance efflux pump
MNFSLQMNSAPPKFRKDVRIRRQDTPQGRWYVVKDPVTDKFFRFREAEQFIAEQLDGETSPDVVRTRVEEKFGAVLSPDTLGAFISNLDNQGLLDNENSSRRKKSDRKSAKRWRGSLLYLRYKVLNPERILEYLIHRVRFFFTPAFVGLSSAAIFLGILITFENWSEYINDVPRLLRLDAIPIYLALGFLVISGHEFAHGLTCRHFGGKVREMGFMFIYFQPGFYCNVSDAWLFPEKSKRMWVGFAGMYFEFFVWAIAVLLWRITDTDTSINFLSLMVMTGSGIATLANLNPLIKLDGYYLLSDYLDIPNLRRKSFRYIGDSLKSFLRLAEKPGEGYSRRERMIYVAYGTIATLASFSLMTIATFEVGSFLIEQSQPLALSLLLGLVGTRFRTRLKRIFGKPTKDDEDFEDDLNTSDNGKRKDMRNAFRNDAPPASGHANQRPYKLRPAESGTAPTETARDEKSPRTLRSLPSLPQPPTIEQKTPQNLPNVQQRIEPPPPPREEKKEKSSKSSRRKKKRKINPIVLGVSGGVVLLLVFFGWMQLRITGPFNILPIQYADVRAEVDGIITEINVREGDQVKQGYVVARISDKEHRSQVQQTQARIEGAQAQLKILETGPMKVEIDVAQAAVTRAKERVRFERSRMDRSKLLYEKDILSLMEYENAQQQHNTAENDLIEAEKRLTALMRGIRQEQINAAKAEISGLTAQMPTLELNLQRAEIRSPVSGIVSTPARQLKELLYQKVDRGSLIARVSDPKKLNVEIAVSEKDVADIKVGYTVAFKARAYPDEIFYGVVTATAQTAGVPVTTQSANSTQPQTPSTSATTILVTSEIDNSSLLLKPGMTGHAKIYCGERRIISLMLRRLVQTVKVEFWSWW